MNQKSCLSKDRAESRRECLAVNISCPKIHRSPQATVNLVKQCTTPIKCTQRPVLLILKLLFFIQDPMTNNTVCSLDFPSLFRYSELPGKSYRPTASKLEIEL